MPSGVFPLVESGRPDDAAARLEGVVERGDVRHGRGAGVRQDATRLCSNVREGGERSLSRRKEAQTRAATAACDPRRYGASGEGPDDPSIRDLVTTCRAMGDKQARAEIGWRALKPDVLECLRAPESLRE